MEGYTEALVTAAAAWRRPGAIEGAGASDTLSPLARGEPIGSVLNRFHHQIHPEVFRRQEGDLRWHFMRQG